LPFPLLDQHPSPTRRSSDLVEGDFGDLYLRHLQPGAEIITVKGNIQHTKVGPNIEFFLYMLQDALPHIYAARLHANERQLRRVVMRLQELMSKPPVGTVEIFGRHYFYSMQTKVLN